MDKIDTKAKGGLFILIGMNLISSGIAVSMVLSSENTFRAYYISGSWILGLTIIAITNRKDPDSITWIGVYIGGIVTIFSSVSLMFAIAD